MKDPKTTWFFIINPRAGSGKTMSEWAIAEKKLEKLGMSYALEYTNHKRHATAIAYYAASEGYRRIVAVGGDGSVHETLDGIMRWCENNSVSPGEFTLGVLPIGSGNDWIKSTGVPHDSEKVVELLQKEAIGQMDVVRVKCGEKITYMCNIGGCGFDSHVCQRVNAQKEGGKRGKAIYLNALRYTILNLKRNRVKVVADGEEIFSGDSYSIALGNGRYSGSGMRQVPRAVIDDGYLDYMIVPRIPLLTMTLSMRKLFQGTIDEVESLISGRCRNLQIIPLDESSMDIVEVDGEIEGSLPAAISVTGDKINIVRVQAS